MDDKLAKTIRGLVSFDDIGQLEANVRRLNRFDDEVAAALKSRANELGRDLALQL